MNYQPTFDNLSLDTLTLLISYLERLSFDCYKNKAYSDAKVLLDLVEFLYSLKDPHPLLSSPSISTSASQTSLDDTDFLKESKLQVVEVKSFFPFTLSGNFTLQEVEVGTRLIIEVLDIELRSVDDPLIEMSSYYLMNLFAKSLEFFREGYTSVKGANRVRPRWKCLFTKIVQILVEKKILNKTGHKTYTYRRQSVITPVDFRRNEINSSTTS